MRRTTFRRIATFVVVRHDIGFTLPSSGVDVSVVTHISDRAQVDYTKTWDSFFGEVVFPAEFGGKGHY